MQSCSKFSRNVRQTTRSAGAHCWPPSSPPSCAPLQHVLEAGYVPLQQSNLEMPAVRQLQQKLMFRGPRCWPLSSAPAFGTCPASASSLLCAPTGMQRHTERGERPRIGLLGMKQYDHSSLSPKANVFLRLLLTLALEARIANMSSASQVEHCHIKVQMALRSHM